MNEEVFICHTPYHLLISLIKVLLNHRNDFVSIIVCNESFIGTDIIGRLRNSGIVKDIIVFEDIDRISRDFHESKNPFTRKRIMQSQNEIFDPELFARKEVYLYNDDSTFGILLNYYKIPYHLIEDGLDCFKNTFFVRRKSVLKSFYSLVQKLAGVHVGSFGDSECMIDLEVNDAYGIHTGKARKIKVVPRKELFQQLSDDDRGLIVSIFIDDNDFVNIRSEKESLLILTQPLDEIDGISKEDKINVYSEIVEQNTSYEVFFKIHPRENPDDYANSFSACHIYAKNTIPIEVLSFIPGVSFTKAITVFSTAINNLDFIEDRESLGEDWMWSIVNKHHMEQGKVF